MVNQSSATGHCSSVSSTDTTSICTDPTSSVLFDGVIPTLSGLDGDMWASQLLTLNGTGSTIELGFGITLSQLMRVEVTMFNCPEWRISVQSISLRDNDGIVIGSSGDLNSITSCDSLVRLCVPATAINPLVVRVQFDLGTGSNWVHLAEVTFYNDSTTCPPNTFITTVGPTKPTTTTTTTQEMTASTTVALTTHTTTTTTTQVATAVTTAAPTTPTTTTTTTQGATTVTIAAPTTPTTATTTQGVTTVTTADPTTPTTTATTTLEMTIPTIETTTAEEMTTATMESDTTPENGTAINESVIIPVVVVICVVFMIVGIMAAVLIQWRYHKHKTSHHTEGHSHPHTHSHPPPVNKYEETGQVCYSSPPEALGQLSPSHDTYSHLQRDTSERRGGAQSEGEYSVVHMKECKGKGEYSVLFHGNKPHMLERDKMEAMRTGDSTTHVYAQIDGVKKGKKETGSTGVTTHPAAYSSLDMSKSWEMAKPDTHLYDQVDKGKKGEMAAHLHTPEADTEVDHFYAVLEDNREKKKGEVATHPHTPETDTAVDQLRAQVDKNQKEKEVSVPLQESGPVYSALNKPNPPQLPAKSDLLMEDLQTP